MPKKLYTANDIVMLVNEQHIETLVLNKGDLITPLARDKAGEIGVKIIEADDSPKTVESPSKPVEPSSVSDLEARVRQVVTAMVAQPQNTVAEKPTTTPPILHVDGRNLSMPAFPFDIQRPEMDVRLEDVITHQHGAPMAAGFMSLHKGNFPWTLTYDEIEYVIEGELHIGTPQGTVVGKPGDVLYVPKGSQITFGTPSWAKFLYVTYPAEWADA